MRFPPSRALRSVAYAAILACWAALFLAAWTRTDGYQWDFKSYYNAVEIFEHGQNPYDPPAFYYPLSALYLLKPIQALSYGDAHRLWVVMKFASLLALLVLWKRVFLTRFSWLVILIISLLAFRAAAMVDIKAGNVSVLEQLLLWTGFALLLKSRFTAFAACVVAASVFKLLPALMLLLLLLPRIRNRANTVRLIAALSALVAITLLPFLKHPHFLDGFIGALLEEPPHVTSNPTPGAVAAELSARFGAASTTVQWLGYGVLIVYYGLLLFASRRLIAWAYRRASLAPSIMVAAMLYALLAPRLMLYSYLIVIVPVMVMVVPAAEKMGWGRYAMIGALCLSGLRILPGVGAVADAMSPLLLLWACWAVLVRAEKAGVLAGAS